MKDLKVNAKMEPVRLTENGSTIYQAEFNFRDASEVHEMLRNSLTLGQWHQESAFGDSGYRVVWINLFDRRIVTYCEGDLTLIEASCTKHFYKELYDLSNCYLSK
jgi:hypothetical protein